MKQFLKKSGLLYIAAAVGCAVIVLLCLSGGQTALDRELLYMQAADCILLREYKQAQDILSSLGDYEDSHLLLDYACIRAAYTPGDPESTRAFRSTLNTLCTDYDGVLLPVFQREAATLT